MMGEPMKIKKANRKEGTSLGWAISQAAAILLAVSLAMPLTQAQQQPQPGETPQSKTKSGGSALARTPDIISDNLDRVAASADQILEVLNKEAGLMVELKRLLAQEAGISGQILEEDRKSTRLNSSHGYISYAVFCLKKKKHTIMTP